MISIKSASSAVIVVALVYFSFIIFKILRKYYLVNKLHSLPIPSFIYGHLQLFTEMLNPSLSLSENALLCGLKHFESARNAGVSVVWLTWVPYVFITNAEAVEAVLPNSKILTKASQYRYFEPWIGTGLLTSKPEKWQHRRKLLTPSFHFRILKDFLKVMNERVFVLVDILQKRETVDLFEIIPLTTLDTICETAMGVNVDAQRNPKSRFVKAILLVTEGIFSRFLIVSHWFDFIFYRTSIGKKFREEVDYIHKFSRNVIQKRRDEIVAEGYLKSEANVDEAEDTIFFGSKTKKLAFMDLLIKTHLDSVQPDGTYLFTIADVCEEADTFTFEGFETTAATSCWVLHLLGCHPEIQEKAYDEVRSIFGDDKERFVTVDDLAHLKYVECCVKEALRFNASVPYIARKTTEEIDVCGHKIPSNVTVFLPIYVLHKDPKYFPNPNEYIPERFFEQNEQGFGHPYAYIPFSAGQRNCIGQRFALYEIKTIVANVLRNFRIRSAKHTKEIPVTVDIITRTKANLEVRFEKRY